MKEMLGQASSNTRIERLLLIVFESGLLYSIFIVSNLLALTSNDFSSVNERLSLADGAYTNPTPNQS
jgi:hypothetical protein